MVLIRYCLRCCYPENSKPYILFDEDGVCSGCRVIEARCALHQSYWDEKEEELEDLLLSYKGNSPSGYDCIIPVSGGKDSHYQVYIIKELYKLNPLLVTYNHIFNTYLGLANLTNLVYKFGCDLLRFTSNPESVRKLSRWGLRKVGDVTWHYHGGIQTWAFQIAVKYKIPLLIFGECGYSELVGMHWQEDMIEFTRKKRQEHSMRGFEPEDILNDPIAQEEGITKQDLLPFYYPSNEEIEEVGVRGIYLSNYMSWNAKDQTELMIRKYGFQTAGKKERTFNIYDKTDDLHASGLHDYLKYLKFGYGRATDDASTEIRHGRMTREEGIKMVSKYDHIRPSDMDVFLKFAGMTEEELENYIAPMRDPNIWHRPRPLLPWYPKDSVKFHINDEGVDKVRLPLIDKTKFIKNRYGKNIGPYTLNRQKEYVIL